jgi:peptidoglycan/LPS O-acetylase OafA/YrhL
MIRLSDDKARRLSGLIWRERLRRLLPLLVTALLLVGAFTAILLNQQRRADRTVDVKVREATVVHIKQIAVARRAAIVTLHLEGGGDVDAFSAVQPVPSIGAHVEVNEARHASGKLTYDVTRIRD